ncbi:MAG: hypothetical protein K9N47_00285 [Prosthecobacter sp.]|uniref:hypothetical protein n=1 Tax=Prosthecobacter sp. TaxID=1965333 RepID=UPI0025E9129F|nr:hypothetical protein [Prosthecobacter sp.]MCF7784521.1 hypothetical protein [Prosthecobacter sp.]
MTLEHAIQDALSRSELPLKAAEIAKIVKPAVGRTATPKTVAAALEALSSSGVLSCIIAGTRSKPQPLFTPHSLETSAAAFLKHFIHAASKEQQAMKLKAKLPAGLQPFFEAALDHLVATGAAFVLPGGKRLVFAHKPQPSQLLDATLKRSLQKVLQTVNSVRTPPATLDDLIAWLDAAPPPPPVETVCIPEESELRAWYDLDRLRSSTVMIPIPQTFARYQAWATEHGSVADSQVLRSLIETLYNNGHLLLEPCERPQDLPDHERALLVPMSLGPPGYSWCWIS